MGSNLNRNIWFISYLEACIRVIELRDQSDALGRQFAARLLDTYGDVWANENRNKEQVCVLDHTRCACLTIRGLYFSNI
jgi:hypothetical protein